MKKILLSLGTIAAVAAPVAVTVSCGTKTEEKGFVDGTATHTDAGNAVSTMMTEQETISPYSHFALNEDFISSRLFNSKKTGISKNMTRSDWYRGKNMFGFTQWVKDKDKSSEVLNATKKGEAQTFEFTKKDIASNANFFEDELEKINKELNPEKQYIYSVESKVEDVVGKENEAENNSGEYIVKIWETNTSEKIKVAEKTLREDFEFKDAAIKELQGMYLFSQSHIFSTDDGKYGLANLNTVKKGKYNDRATDDNLVDWTAYAPKEEFVSEDGKDTEKVLLPEISEKLKDIKIMAKMVTDNKTKEQNIQLTFLDADNISKTIYVPTRKIAELNQSEFNNETFTKVWNEKIKFAKVYELINKLKDNMADSYNLGTNGLVEYFIRISSMTNFLASINNFSNSPEFIKSFGDYLVADVDFNEKAMISGIDNCVFKAFNAIPILGAKGYIGLYWMERTYNELKNFVKENASSHPEWKFEKITSQEQLNSILIPDVPASDE